MSFEPAFSSIQRLHQDVNHGHPVIIIIPGDNEYSTTEPKTLSYSDEGDVHHWILAALAHGFIAVKVLDKFIPRLRDICLTIGIKNYALTGIPNQEVSMTASSLLSDVPSVSQLDVEGLSFDREQGTIGAKDETEADVDRRIAEASGVRSP